MEKNPAAGGESKRRSPLALPLEEYEKLSPEQLQEAADAAGVTPERLKELVSKAANNKKENEIASLTKRAEMDAKQETKFVSEKAQGREYNSYEVRHQLESMNQPIANLDLADTMEKNAYDAFERHPDTNYSFSSFYQAEKIRARQRMYDLRKENTPDGIKNRPLEDIISLLRDELREKAHRSNIPYLRDALTRVAHELPNEFKSARKQATVTLDSYGSAEKFSANAVSGYVKNPRPRRYGDELDHG